MIIIETCPKCGHNLYDLIITTNPLIPHKKCFECGWEWFGEPEQVIRVPFGGNAINAMDNTEYPSLNSYLNDFNKVETFSGEINTFNELSNTLIRDNFNNEACDNCSCNPKNGGTGICFCTVGQMNVVY